MMEQAHQRHNWLEIVKENHEGVVSIHEARYKDAIQHFSRGLAQCRSLISIEEPGQNYADNETKASRLTKTLDEYMVSSQNGPPAGHKSISESEDVAQEESFSRVEYRDPIDVRCPSSICHLVQLSFDDINAVSAIILFNLALAHQLDPARGTKNLRKAMSLYQFGHKMADLLDSGAPNSATFSSTASFRAACLCNMGVINHLLGDYDSRKRYFEGFLRLTILMTATGHPNASRLNDRHPGLLVSLLFPRSCDQPAPAA